MLTLYQLEWCPSCHWVRQVMTELGLTYTAVNVPFRREERTQVTAASGQETVPVLQDGDLVLADAAAIVEHLRATYPSPDDATRQSEMGSWRMASRLSTPPRAALAQLRETLAQKGFKIVSETGGREISEHLSSDYVLIGVVLPEAAAPALDLDPLAPNALLLALAVVPTAGGTVIAAADPVGEVWLFADAPLRKAQAVARRRLAEVLEAL